MPHLLIYPAVDDARLEKIAATDASLKITNAPSLDAALDAAATADALFGRATPDLLARAQRLRWIQSPTASLEHYLFPELVDHPCTLTNMRGLYSDVIADHVIGYLLCFARNLHLYLRRQSAGQWSPVGASDSDAALPDFAAGPGVTSPVDRAHRTLAGATLGIVGLGSIGRELARRAAAFSMRVIAIDEVVTTPPPEVSQLTTPDRLPELLAESDYVVIAAPHTPTTESLFTRAQFQAMRPDAYLINVGRGAIVDLDDLVAALDAHEIAGAALDVFQTEPLPADHPLWRMENVILTPHVAGASPLIAARHLDCFLENLRRFLAGQPLQNVVDKTRWY